MSPELLFSLTGLGLCCLGAVALFSQRSLLRRILAVNICGSGIFLLMIGTAYDPTGGPPDPVLHALVLTGIVIAVSITAFALALATRLSDVTVQQHRTFGRSARLKYTGYEAPGCLPESAALLNGYAPLNRQVSTPGERLLSDEEGGEDGHEP